MMTPRQRLLAVLNGEIPDCVPVTPDFSNMIPCRLTGRPFWDIYLHGTPPLWEAYINAAKHFDIDAFLDGLPFRWPSDPLPEEEPAMPYIVDRTDKRIITQVRHADGTWSRFVSVFYISDSPMHRVPHDKVGLPAVPCNPEPVPNLPAPMDDMARLRKAKQMLGDQGLVGVFMTSTLIQRNEEDIFHFFDHPGELARIRDARIDEVKRRAADLAAMPREDRPDFICVGGSGTLVFQTPDFVREYVLPAVKLATELCAEIGVPTHVHSCGPETELVKLMAEETRLTVIDPLEIPPMGDCNLADLKKRYGEKLTLKGNLHTTDVMLFGSPADVRNAAVQAMRDGARGGRFILSTGDQCGRDTPDENIRMLVRTARTEGRYTPDGSLPALGV